MEMKLRPYQIDAISRVNENLRAGKKVQYVLLPQGSGKTVIAGNIIKTFSETGRKVLVLFTRVVEKEQLDSVVRTFNLHPDFVKTTTIQRLYHSNKNEAEINDDCYDLIISLSNNFLVNSLKIKEKNSEPSLFEKTVNEISSKNQAPIIYFETSPISENLDKIPLLSTDCTFYLSNEQFQREFNSSFIEERRHFEKEAIRNVQDSDKSKKEENDAVLSVLESLVAKIDANHNETSKKLDELHTDVKEILNIVKQINNTTSNYKDILQTYYELHSDENNESDIFTSKVISKLADEISNHLPKIQKDDKYNQARKLVEIRLSNVWDRMDEESKKFLITAKFLFLENMNLENNIDYSSICLLSSKALEVELSKRIVSSYQKYLNEKGLDFENWPSSMVHTYKKGERIFTEKLDPKIFSLGSTPYIMGILGKPGVKEKNKEMFLQFCKENLMESKSDDEISKSLQKIDKYIQYIKDNFRNPAAHKETMSITDATNCLDYILEAEKALRDILECFNY